MPGIYRSILPTLADGQQTPQDLTDERGRLLVSTGTGASSQQVQGTSAAGAADDGSNPVKVGGVYVAAPAAVSTGQRTSVMTDAFGNQRSLLTATSTGFGPSFNSYAVIANNSNENQRFPLAVANMVLNPASGTTVEMRGDATSAFTKNPPLAKTNGLVSQATTTSTTLFNANATRTRLIIQNLSTAADPVWINLGAAATTASPSLRIASGATLELVGTNQAVAVIAAVATAITAWEF